MKKKEIIVLILGSLVTILISVAIFQQQNLSAEKSEASTIGIKSNSFPQYIAVRKSPTYTVIDGQTGNDYTVSIFNPNIYAKLQSSASKLEYIRNGYTEILDSLGGVTGNSNSRKLAITVKFDLLNYDANTQANFISDLFKVSKEVDIPVIFALDGVTWWEQRKDLWEWWDPSLTESEVLQRKSNVEWAGYDHTTAIQKCWRNWGSPIQVAPHPNLAANGYRTALQDVYKKILPVMQKQYEKLPVDKKYLFGGIIIDSEISVGVNYYKCPGDTECLLEDSIPIGFNSARTLGLIDSEEDSLTVGIRDAVVKNYVSYTRNILVDDYGLPSNKIFNHIGGLTQNYQSFDATRVAGTIPGWSMYFDEAEDPETYLKEFFHDDTDKRYPWGTPEWRAGADWDSGTINTLNLNNNKLVVYANWEDIVYKKGDDFQTNTKLKILRDVLVEDLSSEDFFSARHIINEEILEDGNVKLSFSIAPLNTVTYLNISTSREVNERGLLKDIDYKNERLAEDSIILPEVESPLYLQLITDTKDKRMLSEIYTLSRNVSTTSLSKDLDGNGSIDILDLNVFMARYRIGSPSIDFNQNGEIKEDIGDFTEFIKAYRESHE